MSVSDLEQRDVSGQNCRADLRTYACTIWLRTNKYDMVTHEGTGVFLGFSHTPIPRGRAHHFLVLWVCSN